MPTYEYECPSCAKHEEIIQSMREYSRSPIRPECCGAEMVRFYSSSRADALFNAQFGDRHYDGLRATDGTPIDSRSKHREFMRRRGLTTTDDFTETWKKAEHDREKFRRAEHQDRELRDTIAREFYTKQR